MGTDERGGGGAGGRSATARGLGKAPLSRSLLSVEVSGLQNTLAAPFHPQMDLLLFPGRAASKTVSPRFVLGPLSLDASLSRGLQPLTGSGCNPLTGLGSGLGQ